MSTTNAQHFSMEFIEGKLQVVKRKTFTDADSSHNEPGNNTMSTVNSLTTVIANNQSGDVTD